MLLTSLIAGLVLAMPGSVGVPRTPQTPPFGSQCFTDDTGVFTVLLREFRDELRFQRRELEGASIKLDQIEKDIKSILALPVLR